MASLKAFAGVSYREARFRMAWSRVSIWRFGDLAEFNLDCVWIDGGWEMVSIVFARGWLVIYRVQYVVDTLVYVCRVGC